MSDSGFVLSKNQGGIIVAPVIHVQPAEGWGYFAKNKARLSEELVEIATNEDTNTSVYMTEEDDHPYLYVYKDDKKIFQSDCSNAYETERNLRVVYATYMTPLRLVVGGKTNEPDEDDEETLPEVDDDSIPMPDDEDDDTPPVSELDAMSDEEFQEMVDEREDVIFSAVTALIEVLTEDEVSALEFDKTDDDCVDNIVDHIVRYLAVDCGFRIRRPMELVDDDTGFQVRTEYPYEEYDFSEDEHHGR